jgi:predicted dehydrogenase
MIDINRSILIVGLGSIGKRHLNNLIELGFTNISIVSRNGEVKKKFELFKFYPSISDASLHKNIDVIIIATPTSNHVSDLLEALENNINNIYLEKPISHSLSDIKIIEKKLAHSSTNIVVGFDLRFDPGLILMKEYIDTNKIGKILSFNSEVGQYLPDWRPEIDYRKSMSAKKNKGGGVMLDLVHEFDYINWLVGPIKNIVGMNTKISNLDIDTEDISTNLIETTSGAIGSIHLDYLQFELSRSCKIIGDKGVIIWNYRDSYVKFMSQKDRSWIFHDFKSYKRNDRFKDTMKAFMNSDLKKGDKRLVRFKEAIRSLELIELSKKFNIQNFMEKI